jgi:hypothetical protein
VAVVSGTAGTATLATTNSQVGPYAITVTNINLSATNYAFAFTNGTLNVNPATLLVAASPENKIYGSTNPALAYALNGFQNADPVTVVSGAPAISTSATNFSPVGAYPIAITNGTLAATNYNFAFTNNFLTVNTATLLVAASDQSRQFGAANPPLTYGISGFLGTDTVSVVSGIPSLGTAAVPASPVGSYPITVTNGSLAAANYGFAFSNGTLVVTASPPMILGISGAGTTNVIITWSALSNVTYRVQFNSNFSNTNWQNLVPDVTATNSTATQVDNAAGALQRFYRVLVP